MRRTTGDRSHSLKLRVRLMTLVAAVVSAVAGVTAWTCLVVAERAFEQRFDDELAALARGAAQALAAEDIRIGKRLARMSRYLRDKDPDLLERLLDADPASRYDLIGVAEGLANQFELPVLELLDEQGRIVSSAHWPQNAGKTDEAARRIPFGMPVWLEIETAEGSRVARVARLGGRSFFTIQGF